LAKYIWNYQVEEDEVGGACMGEKRNAYRLLVENLEAKKPLRRPRQRCVDNIKLDHLDIGLGELYWIGLAQDR
jgi:hypothetical protein